MSERWKISIEGHGPHHTYKPDDPVILASALVSRLEQGSQAIESATFTFDRVEAILPLASSSSSSSSAPGSSSSSSAAPQT